MSEAVKIEGRLDPYHNFKQGQEFTLLGQQVQVVCIREGVAQLRFMDIEGPSFSTEIVRPFLNNDSYKKMDPDNKKQWLAALAIYKQGRNQLGIHALEGPAYCCLGVYCVIKEVPSRLRSADAIIEFGKAHSTALLPSEVEGEIDYNVQQILAHLNDSDWTFAQISRVIEAAL